MKTPIEYTIVAVPFHADAATHAELARRVNEKLTAGYELLGAPFLSEEIEADSPCKLPAMFTYRSVPAPSSLLPSRMAANHISL